jgi:hypothetical protein
MRTMTARVQLKKSLVVILKGLGAKTNWLTVNCQSDWQCSAVQWNWVGWWDSELVRELLRFSLVSCCCEKLVAEAWGQFGDPEEGERLPLEVATGQRLVKMWLWTLARLWQWIVKCSLALYQRVKSDHQSKTPSIVTHKGNAIPVL